MTSDLSGSRPAPDTGRCGYAVIDSDGFEEPCDRPASGWRWYQNVEHEDALDVACELHVNEGGRRMRAALDEIERLRAALDRVHRLLAPAELFDEVYEAMYGTAAASAEERESVAQLCEALSPLLRAAVAGDPS